VLFVRGSWNARHPIVRQHTLKLSEEKSALLTKPLKIVVASDLHLGHMVGKTHLLRLHAIVRELKPDLVLLPGDVVDDDPQAFVDNGLHHVMQAIVEESRLGAYAVLGNHEYYGRQIERYVEIMAGIGVQVLRDEFVQLTDPPLYIVGRKDVTAEQFARPGERGRLSVAELMHSLDLGQPIIMMDHQPRQFAAALAGSVDVLLCGHTHRGQFAPNHWITRSIFELDWGYMRKQDATNPSHFMHILVSSGFGTWGPPIRLASRAEVLEITLL
jgi:predicted MPP superfamily phosphohydrolase